MKPLLLIQGPASSRSGYGERTRDLILSLIEINHQTDRFQIKVVDMLWGGCPPTALSSDNPKEKQILDLFLTEPLTKQPEFFIQVSVPNEFQRIGSQLNIGVTAGIETTICSPDWIEGCNRMDMIWTSSEHSKNVFLNTKFSKLDQRTQQPLGELKVNVPVLVVFEGIDIETFANTKQTIVLPDTLPSFNFLFVGHWLPGELGHDRKDVGMLIKTFLTTFKKVLANSACPGLILKTGTTFSEIDKHEIRKKINEIRKSLNIHESLLPPIHVVFGELTPEEMAGLYHHPKVKAHISFTKGEGYGRPIAEASLSKKPVIVPNWSGHVDFTPHAIKLAGQLQQIHPSAVWEKVLVPESSWFYVNYSYAAAVMKDVYTKYKTYEKTSALQSRFIKENYSMTKMTETIRSILDKHCNIIVPVVPEMLPLTLPTFE